ncbi:fructose-2,6-bisphosphatase [Rubidibacter lacunae KORDI 51-2]|uniref:Fructose-2,6-bisphosphatase n=1 Tax=Rubidibacter lacunae KORDI 51-2 TaxID=582515 RepID=U5DKJ5_9CHRO|nr:histidine phosphatase family protein [Rubidibacter lacunae]ERN42196.1 fructose-2,6-bisphosphatase [Rubidibacter lacunae KORDI 51-2]
MVSPSQTVWIARHGNRYDFVNPAWFKTAPRPYDPHLSEDGIVQARQLGDRLRNEGIGRIFASPFLRTVQTAHLVAEALDLPIALEAGLSEWLNPCWMHEEPERLSLAALKERFPRVDTGYTSRAIASYPESDTEVAVRTGETARLLAEEFCEDLLLVGHGASVIGTARGLVGGTPDINAALCCLVKVVRQSQGWELELAGDTSHLSETESVVRFN